MLPLTNKQIDEGCLRGVVEHFHNSKNRVIQKKALDPGVVICAQNRTNYQRATMEMPFGFIRDVSRRLKT